MSGVNWARAVGIDININQNPLDLFLYDINHGGIWIWNPHESLSVIPVYCTGNSPWLAHRQAVLGVRVTLATHYSDVIMGAMASKITSLTIVYSTVYSGADQRKHQSSASLAFVRVIHRGPVNSPHKWPVTRKMFPFWWRHHAKQVVGETGVWLFLFTCYLASVKY